ncbi:MAG: sugar ABC transporter ATP-binding protein [Oscillospiraceae bacterium]|nr:sugar ABC transporter ATP-binding protein [Oscillospiraceae bacterium]
MENTDTLLSMKNISKSFPGVLALKDVSFEVCRGEIMGLMGENGAGKSTLIKILTGYYRRDPGKGEMVFDGKQINLSSTLEALHLGISPIFQELNLSPFASVAENIYLGHAPKRNGLIDWKKINADARAALMSLGIDIDVTKRLDSQSTAIQQMTSIARALAFDAKLLIMDEATSSLDNEEVDVLFGVVRQLKQRGISTIFITHKLDEVYKICDRVTILKDGEYVACEPIGELPKLKLISMMIGRDASKLINKKKAYTYDRRQSEIFYSAKNIRKSNYRLNGIDIDIGRGEVVGLAGLLGAGRTELARVIFGDDQDYVGETFLQGMAIKFRSPTDAISHGLAFCSEDRKTEGIFPFMSIEDNLTISQLHKLSRFGVLDFKKQQKITDEYIRRIRIKTPSSKTKIRSLSGGNQQKVVLSRWLAMEPDMIILDEPTRGIDVGAKGEIEDLISEIASQGISVVYISSEIEELVRGCDRIVVLTDGKKTRELVADEISSENIMAAIAQGDKRGTEVEVCQ